MAMNKLQDKIRGSLMGGAIGDAMGYPIEFMSLKAIKRKYWEHPNAWFKEYNDKGKAVISDDTQMTLFTANGLLFGVTRFCTHGMLGAGLKDYVAYAYQDWLQTQKGVRDYNENHYCWIRDVKELNVNRAPGNTCMSALWSLYCKHEVKNDSKGCGGVMRVAPVGLMAAADELTMVKDYYGNEVPRKTWSVEEIVKLGRDCAEITHKHPLGYLPAAFLATLVYRIVTSQREVFSDALEQLIQDVNADMRRVYMYQHERQAMDELWSLIGKAIRLAARHDGSDEDAIKQLGEGWTGDEALAIALYCALRHLDNTRANTFNFSHALTAAVNHDGDSDSTGAICGNLMGAVVGMDAIGPSSYRDLELKELIIELADDIVHGCTIDEYHAPRTEDEIKWETKYVKNKPYPNCPYALMPGALRTKEIRQLLDEISFSKGDRENCRIGYQLALKVFDTDNFDPYHPLHYERMCDEPQGYFNRKGVTPAYYYGYDDPIFSPRNSNRVFRLNILCFEGRNPVIAVRADCGMMNVLRAGLMNYYDKAIMEKYPGWEFYRMDPSTASGNYAVFTNELEKEFAVEIAHLWEDGSLHRIYHLYY